MSTIRLNLKRRKEEKKKRKKRKKEGKREGRKKVASMQDDEDQWEGVETAPTHPLRSQ